MATNPISGMHYILVFKTNLRLKKDSKIISPILNQFKEIIQWNIDREDLDKVLRVESTTMCQDHIIHLIKQAGYHCEELQD